MEIRLTDCEISIKGKVILQEVTLEVKEGETWLIRGKNGSGKSVLLKYLLGLQGKLTGGDSVSCYERLRLCYINNAALFYDSEKISDILRYYKWVFKEDVSPLLVRLEILEPLNQRFGDLSDGTRRKLSIIPLFIERFDFYVLDEILGNLDRKILALCLIRLKELQSLGKTIIFVDHDHCPFLPESYREYVCL